MRFSTCAALVAELEQLETDGIKSEMHRPLLVVSRALLDWLSSAVAALPRAGYEKEQKV